MPYRVDIAHAGDAVLDRLVELGALDVERSPGGGIAALMPDGVAPEHVARALGVHDVSISPAVGRDAGSVWILSPRPDLPKKTTVSRLRIWTPAVSVTPTYPYVLEARDSNARSRPGVVRGIASCIPPLSLPRTEKRPARVKLRHPGLTRPRRPLLAILIAHKPIDGPER